MVVAGDNIEDSGNNLSTQDQQNSGSNAAGQQGGYSEKADQTHEDDKKQTHEDDRHQNDDEDDN